MQAAGALHVKDLTHHYGAVAALSEVNLETKPGEFVTLLGPSGCGKTTLLRIIGGFIRPSSGRVLLHGEDVTAVPPHRRRVNTVFQRSTLFPHLDVFENVAFGLRISKVPEKEVARRVLDALELVRLSGFEKRLSHELSGGQVQRVALARALVGKPPVLLLDEPLSALDLAIRLEMEEELRRLHREVGATFVYVTHDQREALALSDRIAVFNKGRIEQLATPAEIYRHPASPFTARFVGDANVIPVEVAAAGHDGMVLIGEHRVMMPVPSGIARGPAWLVLRPETLRILNAPVSTGLQGIVRDFAYRGSGHAYRVAICGIAEPIKAEIAAEGVTPVAVGSAVTVTWDAASGLVLPKGT